MRAPLARWTASLGLRMLSDENDHDEHADDHASESVEGHEEDVTDLGVGAIVFALAIGVISRSYLKSVIPLPYTVQILVVGIAIGLILEHTDEAGLGRDLSVSLDSIRFMNPHIIFFALLPILIFESAFFTDVHIFLREMWQVLMLAGPGVMVATILMACFSKYVFPFGWDWNTALFFGAMTSATDPVAVVALMKELGVSERLAVLIEGESLLNDGTSIVVFSVFFNAATGAGSNSAVTVVTQFIRLGFGGPLVGLFTGVIGAFTVGYILEDHLSEITATVVVCFSAFLLAEATVLKVSGVLAVVIGGLYMSFYGRPRISPSVQEPLHAFWSIWGYMANTVIFFVTGLDAATKAFGKDSSIEPRDWGYLVALWVAVHIVRGLVVLMSYPVLRQGYGTDWKQLVVLTYAGLRGAVGLTLALIVQEDEGIDAEVGDKIMFMMAGLAIMTLLINGTTCGHLISYFGMDRATKAQTEIFIRACSAVESKLEHVVEQLKKDRFLGDSDWPVVWRYIPVMTSRVYWHRIRYGSVVLANGEDEEIQGGSSSKWCPSCCGAGGACHSALTSFPLCGLNQLNWGKGHDGGATGGGGRFAHLPPRLRPTWQRYHRRFHITEEVEEEGGIDTVIESNITGDYGNENYRVVDDQTMHMPRSGVTSNSYPTASAGGAGLPSNRRSWGPEKIPGGAGGNMSFHSVKDGLRSFVSQVAQGVGAKGGGGGGSSVGPKPSLTSPQLTTALDLAAGGGAGTESCESRSRHNRGRSSGSSPGAGLDVSGRGIRGLDLSGRGKPVADDVGARYHPTSGIDHSQQRRGLRGIDLSGRGKMAGDGRAGSPPGTGSPASLDVSGHSIRGLDVSMRGKRSMGTPAGGPQQGGDGIPRRVAPERAGSAPYVIQAPSGDRRGQQQGPSMRRSGGSMNALDKAFSASRRGTAANAEGLPKSGSQPRGLAAAAIAAANATPPASSSVGEGLDEWGNMNLHTAQEIEATKGALSLAKEHLQEVEENIKDAVRQVEKEDPESNRPPVTSEGGETDQERDFYHHHQQQHQQLMKQLHQPKNQQKQQQQQSRPAGFTKPASAVAAVAAEVAKGNQKRRGSGGAKGVLGPEEQREQLAEARLRFIAAVKANYQDNFRKGWLSDSGLRVLEGNADVQLDNGHLPLQEWTRLRESFTIPDYQLNMASALRYLPVVGQIVGGWIFKKLAFVFELASNFIAAHEGIAILELLPEGDAADQLAKENMKQLDDASGTLGKQLPAFPEVARSLKTQVAARFLLAKHREFVEELYLDGFINEKERESTLHVNTEFKIKLDDHPYAEHLPPRSVMLAKVPFLKSLAEDHLVRIVNDDSFCQEELHGSNIVLLRQSERGKHSGHSKGASGWYYIVRGSVQMASVSQDRDRDANGGPAATNAVSVRASEPDTPVAGEGTVAERTGGVKTREHALHAGAVFGMSDAMLGLPYRATYTTTSFVHLFFFDKNAFLEESMRSEDLNRALWRAVGVSVLRKFYGFHQLRLQELQKMVQNAEFIDLVQDGVGETTTQIEYKVQEIRAKAAFRVDQQQQFSGLGKSPNSSSSMPELSNPSANGGTFSSALSSASPPPGASAEISDDDDGRIHVHKLKSKDRGSSLAKTLSNMGLYHMDSITDETLAEAATVLTPHSSSTQTLKVVEVEPKRLVLLVKGQLLPRPITTSHPGVEMHMAPCLLTDVSGRLVFTKDTKMFLIPVSVVERVRASFTTRRTRLEKAAHREDTIKDLNEHRLPGARRLPADDLEKVTHDALGAGARTDLGARQALIRKHGEMAKRASRKGYSGEDEGGVEGTDGMEGGSGSGGGEEGWREDTVTLRKSFVMKRNWGSTKMVEMTDDEPQQLGPIMEERDRAFSAVSNSARTAGRDKSPLPAGASFRERLGSASHHISARFGRSGSASSEGRRESELEEKAFEFEEEEKDEAKGKDIGDGGPGALV